MVMSSTQTSPPKRGGDPLDVQLKRLRDVAFGQPSPANTGVVAGLGCLGALLALWRRILTHIDNVLDAVIDVPLTCLQGGGMRLADDGLGKSPLSFIDHKVSSGRLLAPQNLALEHLNSQGADPVGLGTLGPLGGVELDALPLLE